MQTKNQQGRVAITGMGILSCLGSTLPTVTESLRTGKSGIIYDEERITRGFRSGLTGRRPDANPKDYGLKRKHLKSMGDPAQFSYMATVDALRDAGWEREGLLEHHAGIIIGNDSCVRASVEGIRKMETAGATRQMGSGYIFQAMNSTTTMNLATQLGFTGANWTVSAACASSAHAIGQGFMLIRSGLQRVVVCGGTQELNWQATAAFDALNAFSTRHDAPEAASRPFDTQRDGLVPSGGAASLVLEDWELAQQRGARIYAEVIGYGFSSDGYHLCQPSPTGATRALQMAFQTAQIQPEQIDYINAHATSTPQGDANEAQVLRSIFAKSPPVSSTKSMTGHECWMAGASELIYSCLMAQHGFLAPNINCEQPDEACAHLDLVRETREAKIRYILSNSFGFGGTNAALLLRWALDENPPSHRPKRR